MSSVSFEDLTGQKFGRLVVIERGEDYVISSGRHYPTWHCKCDCGNEVVVRVRVLKSNGIPSCGCYHRELIKQKTESTLNSFIGKKFNNLTVIDKAPARISPSGRVVQQLVCRCDCGKEREVSISSLRSNYVKTCGKCDLTGSRLIDLTGQQFGKLIVVKRVENYVSPKGLKFSQWLCKCNCGNECIVRSIHLRTGYVQSCGCLKLKQNGNTTKRLWKIWKAMIYRCENKNDKNYLNYGERGIKVCDEWHLYDNFESWALNAGYDSNASFGKCTLNRIDVNGNYEPSNCRWVDQQTQTNNTRKNRYLTYHGVKHTFAEWTRIYNLSGGYIASKVNKGMTAEEIFDQLKERGSIVQS